MYFTNVVTQFLCYSLYGYQQEGEFIMYLHESLPIQVSDVISNKLFTKINQTKLYRNFR